MRNGLPFPSKHAPDGAAADAHRRAPSYFFQHIATAVAGHFYALASARLGQPSRRPPAACRHHLPFGARTRPLGGLLALFSVAAWSAAADPALDSQDAIIDLSLDQLVDVRITSVSKKSQPLSEAPAAIFVITADDIRRAGITSLPEALRLAPGIEVTRIDSNKWAITARGFNGRFANKLLVLMDGRSIYSPLFSGVLWDEHATMLEDIDRIEVIRGPGATLWGANAVNGVINIITRRAQDTQGNLVSATVGSEERVNLGVRHGGTTAAGTAWRVYGKGFERDAAVDAAGRRANDDWRQGRMGFRIDSAPRPAGAFTLQGDVFQAIAGETISRPTLTAPYAAAETGDARTQGANLLGRWSESTDAGESTLQAYYDGTRIDDLILEERRDTFDLDFQRRTRLGTRHDVVWGLGYRISRDRTRGRIVRLDPADRTDRLFSAFLQDEIALGPDFRLTVGSKLEHNGYTGWEIQPGVRALWQLSPAQTAWASVSRAVRTPSRGDAASRFAILTRAPSVASGGLPVVVEVRGSERMDAERLVAYELGWRLTPTPTFSFDLAAFVNDYDRLRSQEIGARSFDALPVPHYIIQTVDVGNLLEGRTYGFEAVAEARPSESWRLVASYSNLNFDLRAKSGSSDTASVAALEGASPRHQLALRSEWSVDAHTDFDAWIKYVDALPALAVGSHTSLNLRLAWRPRRNLELALAGHNLLDDRHPEFKPEFINSTPTEVQRAVHATARVRF